MASMAEVKELLLSQGRIDNRRIFSFATAKVLPDGSWGLCGIGIRDETLMIFDAVPRNLVGEVGKTMYVIPIREISNFKTSNFVLNRYMKFSWNGDAFHLSAFANNCGLNETIRGILEKQDDGQR